MSAAHGFQVEPTDEVRAEIERDKIPAESLVKEAVGYLQDPDGDVEDLALARMFIERGYSEDVSYWLVREAEVRRAPR